MLHVSVQVYGMKLYTGIYLYSSSLKRTTNFNKTSIFFVSRAWSSIVTMLIPNVAALENSLTHFANVIEADEVLLFEKATFLVISHCQSKKNRDSHRFEKVSNIIKQFKLSCSKLGGKFLSIEVRNSAFAAFIDTFTSNTYVMVVMSDPTIPSEATLVNIRNARKYFEELENPNSNAVSHHQYH